MIRQPTTWHAAHAWWRQALRDPRTPRHEADPQIDAAMAALSNARVTAQKVGDE